MTFFATYESNFKVNSSKVKGFESLFIKEFFKKV